MKKSHILIFLFCVSALIVSCAVLNGGNNEPKIEKLSNGNYVYENLDLSIEDVKSLEKLEIKLNPKYEALGFFWSCYGKNNNKFRHGRIWGGGCCTSEPREDECPEFTLAIAGDARVEIDKIMKKYMNNNYEKSIK